MKYPTRLLLALLVAVVAMPPSQAAEKAAYTYVLVHGSTGGGWDWKGIDRRLTARGHEVHRATLTGLGERVHLANPSVNLTTHIDDVVNLILFEDLHDVVLVGHSYGGMVITGVMNRVPERLKHVIFLDAAVPEDGQSSLDLSGRKPADLKVVDGLVYPPWIDTTKPYPRDVPQPLKTFTEPVAFNNPAARQIAVTYLPFVHEDQTEEKLAEGPRWRLAKSRGWTIRTLASDHNAQRSHPEELTRLLEESVDDKNSPPEPNRK